MPTIEDGRETATGEPPPRFRVPPADRSAGDGPDRGDGLAESPSLVDEAERSRAVGRLGFRRRAGATGRAGSLLILWAVLILDFQGLLWLSGAKTLALRQAVEQGAARVESRAVGEIGDRQIQKAIRDQRATLRFWTALALIGDLVVEPLAPAVRALLAATLLAALAALAGRPVGFPLALDECAVLQGFWVLGLALQTALVFALPTLEADASMALLLPSGTYRAASWVAWRQVDAFALLGWAALILGGWRRGQANLATAIVACTSLAAIETAIRIGTTLVTGAAMRLMLIPGGF
ncbi:hypothetical protein [Planctomyces sp. SH-PL62]|uniref:hypothetical protein n=1 Tax=Planctomyces sp. SH-PL62 TaxID=1636152 RepID=UPI00078DA53A|nr:hypothetical protein [Planctomyces sp. SH-PL62]AMV36061.1 hypothetical protein VT85_01360 [Planctomyces sp. SH-PL62]